MQGHTEGQEELWKLDVLCESLALIESSIVAVILWRPCAAVPAPFVLIASIRQFKHSHPQGCLVVLLDSLMPVLFKYLPVVWMLAGRHSCYHLVLKLG